MIEADATVAPAPKKSKRIYTQKPVPEGFWRNRDSHRTVGFFCEICGTEGKTRLRDFRRRCKICRMRENSLKHGGYEKLVDETTRILQSRWDAMIKRCIGRQPRYDRCYRQRGIKVCDEWRDFDAFKKWAMLNGFDSALFLDRIDNDKGYCPENCRWATPLQSANNRRGLRSVICVETGEKFPSAAQAAAKYNGYGGGIIGAIKRGGTSCGKSWRSI